LSSVIKSAVKRSIRLWVDFLGSTAVGRYFYAEILSNAMGRTQKVEHGGSSLLFSVPNALNKYRVDTFSTKEPETLEWIDNMAPGSVFWDIGANVGLYSIYAAKLRGCHVWAFEPSVFNVELLARNIYINGVKDRVCLISLPLTDELGPNHMRMTTTDWGGALSTFGAHAGWDGKEVSDVFQFQTFGLSADDVVQRLNLPQPDFIKMDVDGIEHVILKGAREVLRNVKQVLIEINDDFSEQAQQCRHYLSESGLVMKEKRHSDMIATSTTGFQNTYNQIWVRA
jgi:FkbM family methyltransferase